MEPGTPASAPFTKPPIVEVRLQAPSTGTGSWTVFRTLPSRDVYAPTDAERVKFRRLADQWRKETRALSSDSDIVANFAYYQIIGMGERALPLIFEEMQAHGGRWFWALRAITGENPVKREERGNVRRMTETWLEWARERNYV